MTELTISQKARRLKKEEIGQYNKTGYLKNLPLFDQQQVETLQQEFMEMIDSVPADIDIYRVNNWHKANRWGDIPHEDLPESPDWSKMSREEATQSKYVLWQQVDPDSFSEDQIVDMDLKAGEISLHDDDLIHGSGANSSDRMRAGITFRYCPARVKCDLNGWPNFEVYPARGTDRFQHTPWARCRPETLTPRVLISSQVSSSDNPSRDGKATFSMKQNLG